MARALPRLLLLCLVLSSGLLATKLFAKEGVKTPGRVVLVQGTTSTPFESALLDFEDGSHFVMLSTRKELKEKKDWKQVAPGETRLVVLIHMKAEEGAHVFAEFKGADLEGLFNMGKARPPVVIGGFLYTNTGEEPVRLKTGFKEALTGKHLPKCGSLVLHSATPKQSLSADLAFVFAEAQVAGNLRFE